MYVELVMTTNPPQPHDTTDPMWFSGIALGVCAAERDVSVLRERMRAAAVTEDFQAIFDVVVPTLSLVMLEQCVDEVSGGRLNVQTVTPISQLLDELRQTNRIELGRVVGDKTTVIAAAAATPAGTADSQPSPLTKASAAEPTSAVVPLEVPPPPNSGNGGTVPGAAGDHFTGW
jgi:hypothetical protein